MDRLLRFFMSRFIRRGSITFATASGATFTCGDGTGDPVAVRFLTKAAEQRILLDPELEVVGHRPPRISVVVGSYRLQM